MPTFQHDLIPAHMWKTSKNTGINTSLHGYIATTERKQLKMLNSNIRSSLCVLDGLQYSISEYGNVALKICTRTTSCTHWMICRSCYTDYSYQKDRGLHTLETYIVSEQAAFTGLSNLRPFSSSWTRVRRSAPG